ncbi:unnamed protein product [Prorocentrum cordatum]|uniref:Phospholipase B-like n=1 Tax=Prorocentrum cordatum TaxID=2364126 RepID=A0ABN9VCQ9_9DINO|nr:unnamed protein product [Polarella glacialis]
MAPLRRAGAAALGVAAAAAQGPERARDGFVAEQGARAADFRAAMGGALGCGRHVEPGRLDDIERALLPTWRSLPKNGRGRIERRPLRYLTRRYFQRASSLVIRGLEPTHPAGAAGWGGADIVSQRVPEYVESVLQSRHVDEHGFDLRDATLMVATVEQLIFDSEATLLEKVYARQRKPTGRDLTQQGLQQVLEAYMVVWMLGDDASGIDSLLSDRHRLHEAIPHWDSILHFTRGEIRAYDYRQRGQGGGTRRSVLTRRYSFDDVHHIVGGMTKLLPPSGSRSALT